MPGRLFLTCADTLQMTDPPRRNIAPGQEVIVQTVDGFSYMRWGIIPVGRKNARGRPVLETIVNIRSETAFDKSAFDGLQRAVVPVEGWYEWTGAARRKTAWAIRPKGGGLLYFAALFDIWTAPGGQNVPQVATLTCDPSADVRDIHHRMGVLLHPDDIPTWLGNDDAAAQALMRPFPDGQLLVGKAEGVDWSGP